MKTKLTPWLSLALVAAAALPFASDGVGECCNATTSLAAGVTDPTNGDEAFFAQSSGAAGVMLLIDNSGSMAWLPQCPFGEWDDAANATGGAPGCASPTISPPDDPAIKTTAVQIVNGTCLPATDTASLVKSGSTWGPLNAANLAWMEAVVPQIAYADPGRGLQKATDGTVLQDDRPPWGGPQASIGTTWLNYTSKAVDGDCTGNNCLFDPAAYYFPNDWTVTSATRRAHDTDTSLPAACLLLDGSGNRVKDKTGAFVSLGAKCTSCMANHGFFLFNVKYANNKSGANYVFTSSGTQLYFKGSFLNANPPKAVTARKVVKDLLWVDDASPSKLDQVRMGMAWFAGDDQGGLPVTDPTDTSKPLGLVPTKALSFPVVASNFKKGRLPIMKFINANGSQFASTNTPLAHTLLSVGQYFADTSVWSGFGFGSSFNNSAFSTLKTADKCSICWDCQRNSVVIVTDGAPNETETGWPSAITSAGTADFTSFCGTGGANCSDINGPAAMLPQVAYFLNHTALHPAGGLASSPSIYTVGVNLPPGDPQNVLKAAGNMGGGSYENAANPDELARAVFRAVLSAADVQSSFSAPSLNAFQISQTSTSQAFLSRFLPKNSNAWEGHVFAGKIFDEFANGCDPTKPPGSQTNVSCNGVSVNPNFNGSVDASGNATCSDVFLVDQNCKAIQEGGKTGEFFEVDFTSGPTGTLTSTPAKFAWDGGYLLNFTKMPDGSANASYRTAFEPASADAWGNGTATDGTSTWQARNIWTVVPNGSGGWTRTAFTTANLAALQPFLSVDPTWCTGLLADLGFSATSSPALPATAAAQATKCAEAIVDWVRGFDLFDQDGNGCGAPNMPRINPLVAGTTCHVAQERNRENLDVPAKPKTMFWKLGDTFHSSPVAVKPPVDTGLCNLALDNQCVATLYSPSWLADAPHLTPLAMESYAGKTMDAYSVYWAKNSQRRKVVLAGANDGMLHAFDAGSADTSLPTYPTGGYQYTDGTGEEMWAFIPPDLLPKLWRLVKKNGSLSDHQYMVDGSTMVRDIWVDANGDSIKQDTEYHTIAIMSERSGGTQYTALDVTDPLRPVVRWAFPQPCSDDAKYMGQSWSDFAPRPPPIGPVKIKSTAPRGFDETWIAMLNGGYDPLMGLGRAVFMVDAWTGATVWRFTDDDFKARFGYGSGTSMFPVPGAVSLTDLGAMTSSVRDQDGFFDTATWGDLGGNLFVARFSDPGDRSGPTGRVGNWYAGRAFEESRGDGNDQQLASNRSEFYYMPANTYEGTTRTLRTYLGSGNREQLMQVGSACGTDNLFGCCQAGCQVSATGTDNFGACDFKNVFSCDGTGALSRGATGAVTACSTTAPAVCGTATVPFTSQATVAVTCPGATVATTVVGSTSVTSAGVAGPLTIMDQHDFGPSSGFRAQPLSRFYGVWAYGGAPAKQFTDAATVTAFERNRFTDVALSATSCSGPTGNTCTLVNTTPAVASYNPTTKTLAVSCSPSTVTNCQATERDAGWYYQYLANERSGSGASVGLGCTGWTSLIPIPPVTSGSDACGTATRGSATINGYLANYVSGVPSVACGYLSGTTLARSAPRNTTAPPISPSFTTGLNRQGQVQYAVRSVDPGAAPSSKVLGTRSNLLETVYWLEAPQSVHNCRHVPNSQDKNCE